MNFLCVKNLCKNLRQRYSVRVQRVVRASIGANHACAYVTCTLIVG